MIAEKAEKAMKKKWSDNTLYMVELFQARKRRTTKELAAIFEDIQLVSARLRFLESKGLIKRLDYGVWECVE